MRKLILITSLALAVSGCVTTPPPIYYYGDFNKVVYSYFNADEVTVEEQITTLQTIIQNAQAKSLPVAPGVHAQLGMLYFQTGNNDLGRQEFELEEQLFPESKQYIDFLLKSVKGV